MKQFSFAVSLFALLFSISLFSCKKEDNNNNPDKDPDNNIVDSIPQSIDNYLPTTEGSWWLYNSSLGKQFKRESTGLDTFRGGLTMKYFIFTDLAEDDPNPEYFNRFDDNKYFSLFTLDSSIVDPTYIPIIIMKDNPTVGMTWINEGSSSTGGFGTVLVQMSCTVESLTEKVVLDDTTFNNAIKVKGLLKAKNAATTWVDCGSITFWFVKRVGVVQQDYNVSLSLAGITLYEKIHLDVLKSYHIEY